MLENTLVLTGRTGRFNSESGSPSQRKERRKARIPPTLFACPPAPPIPTPPGPRRDLDKWCGGQRRQRRRALRSTCPARPPAPARLQPPRSNSASAARRALGRRRGIARLAAQQGAVPSAPAPAVDAAAAAAAATASTPMTDTYAAAAAALTDGPPDLLLLRLAGPNGGRFDDARTNGLPDRLLLRFKLAGPTARPMPADGQLHGPARAKAAAAATTADVVAAAAAEGGEAARGVRPRR
jgi:hypothetical protein